MAEINERGPRGPKGEQGQQGEQGEQGDPGESLAAWLDRHPGTVLYIAIMVTASLLLQLVLVVTR
jgi:hypothetical protein